jgi:ATP-binding cassette subfamily B multidrug efflux pump
MAQSGSSAGRGTPAVRLGMGGGGGGWRLTGESATNSRDTIRRLIAYVRPYRGMALVVAALVVVGSMLNLFGPILLGQAIDHYVIPRDADGLLGLVVRLLLIYAGAGIATILQGLIMVQIGQRLVADLRAELFAHLQRLSMDYHDRHRVGDLMSRVTNDTDAINTVLSNGLIDLISNGLTLGGTLVAMFFLNWQLATAMIIVLPLMLYATGAITNRSRLAFRGVRRHLGELNAVMEENLSGIRVVKAFSRERDEIQKFRNVNDVNRAVGIKADVLLAILGPMFSTMSTITIAIMALLGGWLALRGLVSVGVIATFVIYIVNFFRPMRALAMLYNQLQSALAGAERIFEVLDEQPSVQDAPDAVALPRVNGDVRFDGVSFSYIEGRPVLENVNISATPGQTIALVGPTGAGKTTVINLLSRFYDVDAGAIYVDLHDIRTVQQASLRSQLGIVLQDTFLFSNTVMENIRYGRLDATDDEVIEAARIANADRFIRLLPHGYATKVSEQGHNFSQGQRQLIAIARAILADPRVLILDEATSSVDTRTEMHLQEALLRLLQGRTAFVIAHRLSTIRKADQVLVVNDHRIIERGTHDELLAQGGFYHDLYHSQFRRLEMARPGATQT